MVELWGKEFEYGWCFLEGLSGGLFKRPSRFLYASTRLLTRNDVGGMIEKSREV